MKQPPFLGIEIAKEMDNIRIVEPMISEPLSDMGPVFLFYMGVVILVIGPASGKLYWLFSLK